MSSQFRIVEVAPGPAGVEASLEAIHELFEDDQSVALIAPGADQTALFAEKPLLSDEPSLILLTSGSTGTPRGVEIPVTAIAESAAASAVHFGNQAVWLTALPATSMGGINTIVRSALAGTEPVIWDGVGGASPFIAAELVPFIDATVVGARKQKLAAAASFVPTQMHRLLNDAESANALKNLDYVLVGGGALAPKHLEFAQELGIYIVRTYGATETCGGCVYDGVPLEGVEVIIDETGRIAVEGPVLAHSYRDGEVIAAHGWHSSDLGAIADGRLTVSGRVDDQIKVAGHLVNLLTLAQAARQCEGVVDAAAAGRVDTQYEFVPVIAYQGSADADAVENAIRTTLHDIRIPLLVKKVDEIPMLPNGKPDRGAISAI